MWSYSDSLNLMPHPDFLILADDCQDYHHKIMVNGYEEEPAKHVHVINPGNFARDKSFVVLYPIIDEVQPSNL
jgi:hypothetical protein